MVVALPSSFVATGLINEPKSAESGAEKAYRRSMKAKVKANDAVKAADELMPGTLADEETPAGGDD